MLKNNKEILEGFPNKLKKDLHIVLNTLYQETKNPPIFFKVNYEQETLIIPERIYFYEPSKENWEGFTEQQRTILACLFTRHYNGFLREKYLTFILRQLPNYHWVTPYIVRLIGEYVIEILDTIYLYLSKIDMSPLKDFLEENLDFAEKTKSRVTSYWNCYYRMQFPVKDEYVGFKILKYLDI